MAKNDGSNKNKPTSLHKSSGDVGGHYATKQNGETR